MALLSQGLEPVGFLQALRSLALGAVAHLQGSASAEELAFVRRELELLERELAAGPGLLEDGGLAVLEDCVAASFAHLCLAVRAGGSPHAARETDLFLQGCVGDKLERRLLGLWRRVQGCSVVALQRPLLAQVVEQHRPRRPDAARLCRKLMAVLGAGLLALLCEAGLTRRDPALLLGVWGERVAAVHSRTKEALALCAGYFRPQAQEDLQQALILHQQKKAKASPDLAELAAGLLRKLEQNYDWLSWAVMAWKEEEVEEEEEEGGEEGEEGPAKGSVLAQGDFVAGRAPEAGLRAVACFRESPSALDRACIHRLVGDLEWKLPNPPPEVYARLEARPALARGYLARRMLRKLAEGLGPSVTVLVVPGPLEMRSNFPAAASLRHEYRHRMASGTVCLFG
ncbi:uncharacterized protein LOC134297297 [Anolis carolinensis]|uniref:uncharacterized protein LOC134297297 n=1 Tax=Anolis carolinensis TaxID=28377 RepID=UPI002F2B2F4D